MRLLRWLWRRMNRKARLRHKWPHAKHPELAEKFNRARQAAECNRVRQWRLEREAEDRRYIAEAMRAAKRMEELPEMKPAPRARRGWISGWRR